MYYKVLLDGKWFHGGDFQWSLPENGKPGKWHSVEGDLKMCERGFHLTDNPQKWWDRNAKCYEDEYKDALEPQDDKICVRKVRLVRELTEDDLAKFQIFYSGTHEVTSGKALAYDFSQVTASGSSQVRAYNSSQVRAYDSSTITSRFHSGTVELSGDAIHINRDTNPPTIRGNFQ